MFQIVQSTWKGAESTVGLVKPNSLWLNITATYMTFHIQQQFPFCFCRRRLYSNYIDNTIPTSKPA